MDDLQERLGPTVDDWTWEKLHLFPLKHVLGTRGDLGSLLNYGGQGVRGDMQSVCNTVWTIDAQSQSGQPGSPHYRDQLEDWLAGDYHHLPLDRAEVSTTVQYQLTLRPK